MEQIFRKSGDFTGQKKCPKYKKHNIDVVSKGGLAYDKAVADKDLIKEYIAGNIEADDVLELLEGGLMNATDVEDSQKKLVEKNAKDIRRYIRGEKSRNRDIRIAPCLEFPVGEEYFKESVDAVAVNGNKIEGIIYKASKPSVNWKTGIKEEDTSNLEKWFRLYTGLKWTVEYMKKLCDVGELKKDKNYDISCSYYFLQKSSDKDGAMRDEYFFSGEGGNVISLEETHRYNEAEHNTEYDDIFLKFMEKADEGIECSEDDCKYCDYRNICQYTKPSKHQEKKEVKAGGKVTLSDAQKAVIDEVFKGEYKSIKVNAGAGSGKTTTMKELYASILEKYHGKDKKYHPEKVLILSFTDAGVKELKERCAATCLEKGIAVGLGDIEAYTFNAFGFNTVKREYKLLGLKQCPELLTAEYQMQFIEDIVNRNPVPGVDYSRMDYNGGYQAQPWVITLASKAFEIMANKHIDADDINAENVLREALNDAGFYEGMTDQSIQTLVELYGTFKEQYMEEGYLTYADQEPMMLQVFDEIPNYVDNMGYEYIIVDEYQDSNEIQMETLRRLCTTECFKCLIVVGDDAQSIFAFRETSPEFMINFESHIGMPTKTLNLLENRRSTAKILELANKVIGLNENKIDKDLIPVREEGKTPFVQGFHSKDKEYDFIVEEMEKLHGEGESWEEIAFIASTKAELVAMASKLSKKGIPWVMKNPMNLLENSRVDAALSLSNAFYEPDVTSNYLNYLTAKYDGNILDVCTDDEINAQIAELRDKFTNMDLLDIDAQRAIFHQYLEAIKPSDDEEDELYNYFLELLYQNKDFQSELRYTRIFKKYGAKMAKKLSQNYVGVTLVTAHSSKGLEWNVVFNSITKYDISFLHKTHSSKCKERIEEKRRVLFVSLTRARNLLYVTAQYKVGGNEKDGYIYNQFLNTIYVLLDKEMDPIDHEAEERKRLRQEEQKVKAKERRAKQAELIRAKASRQLTEEERKAYNKMTLNAYQTSLF